MAEPRLDAYRYARVLVVVAHMDDEALFAGGTLQLLGARACEVAIAVATDVADTNRPRDSAVDDAARQQRRLVAFGRVCGMVGAVRTHLLRAPNARDYARSEAVAGEVADRLAPVLEAERPAVVVTHGADGEYGHPQHRVVHDVVRRTWGGPLWCFDAVGPLAVAVDLDFKRRLLDCYRYGTTQDALWSPYAAVPAASPVGPWLGAWEHFRPR